MNRHGRGRCIKCYNRWLRRTGWRIVTVYNSSATTATSYTWTSRSTGWGWQMVWMVSP